MYYPSKKGLLMTIICWIVSILPIVLFLFFPESLAFNLPTLIDSYITRILLVFPISFLTLWTWFKTGYTITQSKLKIIYGPYKKNIDVSEIKSIKEIINPFIDPALSMYKLEISYDKYKQINISPQKKIEFINHLLDINPNIKIVKD